MLEIVNRQRKIKVDLKSWDKFVAQTLGVVSEAKGKRLTIAFVSDKKMRELNSFYRGKNKTTDVLSFPAETDEFDAERDNLGDIAVSLEQAARQAAENGLDFETEIKQLILHGILHLCGYDHETDDGAMNRKELKLRAKLGI